MAKGACRQRKLLALTNGGKEAYEEGSKFSCFPIRFLKKTGLVRIIYFWFVFVELKYCS